MSIARPDRTGPEPRAELASGPRAPGRWLWALVLLACGGAGTTRRSRPEPPPLRSVERLLPDGAEWIVLARPAELWRTAAVRRAMTPAVRDSDLAAFATRTGIHVVSQEELVAAGYASGATLVILRGPDTSKSIRATQQLSAVRPFGFRAVRADVAAVATGPDAASLLAQAHRRARLRTVPELAASARQLRALVPRSPLQLLVLTPLRVERDTPSAVLLSGVTRMAAGCIPRGAELAFRVVLEGDFPPTARDNFGRMLDSMAATSFGEMFGLSDVARGARIEASLTRVQIDSAVAAAAVSAGIETLFVSKLRELLGPAPQSSEIVE